MEDKIDIRELLDQADRYLDANQAMQALNIYKRILQSDSTNADAWLMIGAIQGEAGELDVARKSVENAIKSDPGLIEAHLSLAYILDALGMDEESIGSLRNAIGIFEDDEEALQSLTLKLIKQKQYNEAVVYAKKLTNIREGDSAQWKLLGWLRYKVGDLSGALTSYKTALEINVEDLDTMKMLGIVFSNHGELEESNYYLKKYINTYQDDVEVLNLLGYNLLNLGELSDAKNYLERLILVDSENENAYINLSSVFQQQGRHHKALAHMNSAIKINPNRYLSFYRRAGVYADLGNKQAAVHDLEQSIKLDPECVDAYAALSDIYEQMGEHEESYDIIIQLVNAGTTNLQVALVYSRLALRYRMIESCIQYLHNIEEAIDLSVLDKIKLYNALGRLYDSNKDYHISFTYYKKSNNLKISSYDAQRQEHFINSIIDKYRYSSKLYSGFNQSFSYKLIFIIGLPRTGTTLAEQILSSHSSVYGAGESLQMSEVLHKKVTQNMQLTSVLDYAVSENNLDLQGVILRKCESLDTPKKILVCNERPIFQYIGEIKKIFPESKIIHCIRDPLDACLSSYFQMLSQDYSYTYKFHDYVHYYKCYTKLMNYWGSSLNIDMYTLDYKTLVQDTDNTIRSLIKYCGLEWEDACLKYYDNKRDVVTPSYDQVRRPIYTSSLERWRNYHKDIQELEQLLSEI